MKSSLLKRSKLPHHLQDTFRSLFRTSVSCWVIWREVRLMELFTCHRPCSYILSFKFCLDLDGATLVTKVLGLHVHVHGGDILIARYSFFKFSTCTYNLSCYTLNLLKLMSSTTTGKRMTITPRTRATTVKQRCSMSSVVKHL